MLGGKWKTVILFHLTFAKRRNGELLALMHAITQKVLTQQLRERERDGILRRTVYNEAPPKVEYELMEHGWSLKDILHLLCRWGDAHIDRTYGSRAGAGSHSGSASVSKQP